MADFEPDPGSPKSVVDALPPPAPPFKSPQSKTVSLNIVTHSIDPNQDATPPGTEIYMTSYDAPVITHPKLDHDHNDQQINGICYITKQVQTDKLCNQNLEILKKETANLFTTSHKQSRIHINGTSCTGTTYRTFPQICRQTPLTTVDTTKHRTKHPSPHSSTDAAHNLVIALLNNSQKLASILSKMTQSNTKILAIVERSSTSKPCDKPETTHLGHSTAPDTEHSTTQNPNYPQPDNIDQPKLELPILLCTTLHSTKTVLVPQCTGTMKLDPKHSDNRNTIAGNMLLTNHLIPEQIL